jgi:uncharacterized protein (TIGR02246 family)
MFTAASAQEAPPKLDADEEAVVQNALAFVENFNKGDAAAIAAGFTENGEMSVDGVARASGRATIQKEYETFFKENPGAEISVHVDSMRRVGPNLMIESGVSELINDDDDSVVDLYTAVHSKENGKWLTVSADVEQAAVDPFDWKGELGFLVGTWTASNGDWKVETVFSWVDGGNFLRRNFKVYEGDQVNSSGVQLIGWDPVNSQITAWTFTSEGGFGRAWWEREDNRWIVTNQATTPEGRVASATNLLTFLSNDEFRWQSTNRSVSGVALEDTPTIRLKRTK